MKSRRLHRRIDRTRRDKARLRAIREKFQRTRPTLEQLLASGDYSEPIPHGVYLALCRLKHERERAGLSLADVAKRSGMDRAAISRLENGRQPNPTLDTLCRYAAAIGKQLVWVLKEQPSSPRSRSKVGSRQ